MQEGNTEVVRDELAPRALLQCCTASATRAEKLFSGTVRLDAG